MFLYIPAHFIPYSLKNIHRNINKKENLFTKTYILVLIYKLHNQFNTLLCSNKRLLLQ